MKRFSKQYEQGYSDGRQSVINDRKYNGWSNYETWVTKLWMDNDQGSSEYWQEQTQAAVDTDKEDAVNNLAGQLKDMHESQKPEIEGVFADLLNAAFSEVDWYEIAESMVNDYVAEKA